MVMWRAAEVSSFGVSRPWQRGELIVGAGQSFSTGYSLLTNIS